MNEFTNHDIWDQDKTVNNADLAATVAGILSDSSIAKETISGPFLGLGAGIATAELSLASRLDIQDITLIDKETENIPGFNGSYIPSDLFDFLNKSTQKFGIVTAFGMEYILNNRENWQLLWSGLEHVTRVNSIVLTFPHGNTFTLSENDSPFKVIDNGNVFVAQRVH
jgi:hypothetical protein